MKVLQINSVYGVKSTGRIAYDINELAEKNGFETCAVAGEGRFDSPDIYVMSSKLYQKANILLTRLFGRHGFYNRIATKRLLKWMDMQKPDIIHLHNLHGHYINIKLLFDYINKHDIPIVWTLHDCWAFTGHCSHFDYAGCDKWKSGCSRCPQRRNYPDSWFFDRSKSNFRKKRELFTSVRRMHIVTPSGWLKSLAEQSFLRKYPITVINNGIDRSEFVYTPSDLRSRLGIEDKFVILGVVGNLDGFKGGQYFLELSKMLSEDEHIVLLSLEDTDGLPDNITPIKRAESKRELAKIYSIADVFVNPTLQDTFSMVNIEAMSCSVPVVTFDSGGCRETIDENSGILVPRGDVKMLYDSIEQVKNGRIKKENCTKRGKTLEKDDCFKKYLKIYQDLVK